MTESRYKIVKRCACGAEYTAEQFAVLPEPLSGGEIRDDTGRGIQLRNCSQFGPTLTDAGCGSVLALAGWVLSSFVRDMAIENWIEMADECEDAAKTLTKGSLVEGFYIGMRCTYRDCAWGLANIEMHS